MGEVRFSSYIYRISTDIRGQWSTAALVQQISHLDPFLPAGQVEVEVDEEGITPSRENFVITIELAAGHNDAQRRAILQKVVDLLERLGLNQPNTSFNF